MSKNEERSLQRSDIESKLPFGYDELSAEEKGVVIKRMLDQDIELRKDVLSKLGTSKIAEYDLKVAIAVVERLDHDRKIYSKHVKGKTGSGEYELRIRGGDTKFIIPILVVIGVIILGIILILALR